MSFRSRVALLAGGILVLALLLSGAIIFTLLRSSLLEQVDNSLKASLSRIRFEQPAGSGKLTKEPNLDQSFNLVRLGPRSDDDAPYVEAVGADGVVRPAVDSPFLEISTTQAERLARTGGPAFFDSVTIDDEPLRLYTQQLVPGVSIRVARSLEETNDLLNRFVIVFSIVGGGALVLVLALGNLIARAVLAPVRRLRRATEEVAASKDLARQLDESGPDELARLARSFNSMLYELDASLSSQQRFVADASHELRTPLASLTTNLEVLARSDGEMDEAERRALISEVVEQSHELGVLMTDLLELSKGESTDDYDEYVRLDVLVEEAIRDMASRHPESRYAQELSPTLIKGAPARIDRAVKNLLDNAAKWNDPRFPIEVRVADGSLTVTDNGPGISEDDLPHVFDRFYRSPHARGTPGSGLGLAIAKQVVESCGGSIAAAKAPGGGATFSMNFPFATEPEPSLRANNT